ncbi:MAG TPA: hypothetical protein VGE07_31215 [Herpetosiphonaceae bacterium]
MFIKLRRLGSFALMAAMMLMLLAACGGTAASASPEDRVKSFFTDFNAALNDPKIGEAETQEKYADTLSKYFLPADQAKQKEEMKTSLSQIGPMIGAGGKFSIEGITTEKVSETDTNAEVKITGGKMKMTLGGETNEEDLSKGDFVGGSNPKLQKEGGVWYFLPETK